MLLVVIEVELELYLSLRLCSSSGEWVCRLVPLSAPAPTKVRLSLFADPIQFKDGFP